MARPKKTESTGYAPKAGEEGAVHVRIREKSSFNQVTGEMLSKPWIHQSNTLQDWKAFPAQAAKVGYIIMEVLHLPEGYPTLEELQEIEAERLAEIERKRSAAKRP